MSASAPPAGTLTKNVHGIRARHEPIHYALGQQYFVASCERSARSQYDLRRTHILERFGVSCSFGISILGHEGRDITNRNVGIRA
jgi:hypothetical protein